MDKDYFVIHFIMRCNPFPSLSVWDRLRRLWSTGSDRTVPYNVRENTVRAGLKRPKVLPLSLQVSIPGCGRFCCEDHTVSMQKCHPLPQAARQHCMVHMAHQGIFQLNQCPNKHEVKRNHQIHTVICIQLTINHTAGFGMVYKQCSMTGFGSGYTASIGRSLILWHLQLTMLRTRSVSDLQLGRGLCEKLPCRQSGTLGIRPRSISHITYR